MSRTLFRERNYLNILFCWLICRNTETHILLNNTNNLHLKFICLVPWSPTEQNVCNKYSCAGDTIALEKTKTWSLVQEAYSPKEVREEFWETWLLVWVCFFPNVPCAFLMVWLCSCWFFFVLKAGMPVLFTSHQKPTQALRFHLNVTWSVKLFSLSLSHSWMSFLLSFVLSQFFVHSWLHYQNPLRVVSVI